MGIEDPRWIDRTDLGALRPRMPQAARLDGLWLAGSLAALGAPAVAVVGARAPSEAARRRAHDFGRRFAAAGLCVVSGLALGIDGAAHAGALEAAGLTVGVLGGGHRRFYPRRNRALAEAIVAKRGAVVSPFDPDQVANPWQFLERNGVVVALADAVVIVEAAARSGALNTAGWAASASVPVFAVPGDVDRPKAAGCNALIRDGATLVRNADDVLIQLGFASVATTTETLGRTPRTDPLEAALLAALREPLDLDALLDTVPADAGNVLAALVRLEIDGALVRRDDLTYARR